MFLKIYYISIIIFLSAQNSESLAFISVPGLTCSNLKKSCRRGLGGPGCAGAAQLFICREIHLPNGMRA